ncbi:hypothetical protein Purlil1_339 [Purpureocillium lilacinum]|uniref:Uncharacterized protein n=1 Tax=Purpureocillium lilacinum TaxID=33203 RepID=A0ABR0CI23_PURLI|nr:hypothetical protein Purlil1_339 [Purpureocillium lilacinum]
MRSSQWLVEGSGSIMPSGKSSAGSKLHSGASAMSSKLPFDESWLASTPGYRSGGRAVSRLLRSIVDIDDHHTWFSRPPELLQARSRLGSGADCLTSNTSNAPSGRTFRAGAFHTSVPSAMMKLQAKAESGCLVVFGGAASSHLQQNARLVSQILELGAQAQDRKRNADCHQQSARECQND